MTAKERARLQAMWSERVNAVRRAAQAGVFISYSRSDEIFAVELATQLRIHRVNIWLDVLEVDPSADWQTSVNQAIKQCGVMLAVLSPHSVTDQAIYGEWERFQRIGKLVQPVVAAPCDYADRLKTGLIPINFTKDFDNGLHRLLTMLGVRAGVR